MQDYQAAIAEMFERSVAEACTALVVPPETERPAEARRIVGLLAETIAGYAAGLVTRELGHAVHTWFGAESAALVHAAAPLPRTRAKTHEDFDAPEPTLREELVLRLRARLAETAAELRMMIEVVAARLPGDRTRAATAMFGELARTAQYDDRLAGEIALGWRCACAAIGHTPMPDVASSPRARDLWRIWSELVGNPTASESRQGAQRDGFIALVS